MRITHSMRTRLGRYPVILLALLVFIALMVVDEQRFFAYSSSHSTLAYDMVSYGFSLFVALFFLAVGMPVWLFARERWVAFLLFCFSFAMMMTFALETGAVSGDPVLSAISDSGAALSLTLFATLLLFFPVNHYALAHATQSAAIPRARRRFLLLRVYVWLVWGLNILFLASFALKYFFNVASISDLATTLVDACYLVVLIGIITTLIFTYRRRSTLRERQQLRFFVIGVVAAIAPFLFFTILPALLGAVGLASARYVVDGQVSTITMILLPAAFGYSILRYQILAFDRYIRRVVAWTIGAVLLVVLGYSIGVMCGLLFSPPSVLYTGLLISSLVVLTPLCWWLAHFATERLFFSEMRHYRRLVDRPDALSRETLDITEAAQLLTLAAVNTFETREVCLFVLDSDSGHYQLVPPLSDDATRDAARQRLSQRLLAAYRPEGMDAWHSNIPSLQFATGIEAGQLLLRNVDSAKRPLFLSEAVKPVDEQPAGLARFLSTSEIVDDPLLVAVRVQGEMIGLLVLGERGDHGSYAGPDFEVIDFLLSRYSPLLENARLYEQASRHGALLNALYSAGTSLERTYQSIEEVASAYAEVAAAAAKSGADVWLVEQDGRTLRHVSHAGEGPLLPCGSMLRDGDWRASFSEGATAEVWPFPHAAVPASLAQVPCYPFAWLPLEKGEQPFGILALTYPRPHLFSQEEKGLWGMFASRCAAAIENARAAIALREAYERQKELDQLKDQFIVTASHELRTPLTAVQGYIELLQSYDEHLTPEARAEFIAKAGRGCDELTLMVNNIMDASHVREDVEVIDLSQVPLAASVNQVLEMLEAIIRRENRKVSVDIAQDIVVMAEEQRLKQIILNLVSNALKYSPGGTALEISARAGDDSSMAPALCEVRIRDYGSGVPLEEQSRLFERFVRLERDMNSPVRGAGLGLFICRQLVGEMGGNIWMESTGKAGEGSTFIFSLKLYRTAQVPVR